ncbi:MAG TPA: hypothetical protein PLZ94_12015 [Armatimonadota bacterium]|nr:hypothetical protein [Armatimonadota bacterium]HPO72933.1 hypothetical protein [Armatimonadota bacterium]
MSNTQKSSPATIAALIAGCCLAVGFAAWNITRAMRPAAPPADTASTAKEDTAPVPLELAGPPPLTPAQERRMASGETALAPHADPFVQLPDPPAVAATSRPPSLPPLATASTGGSQLPTLPAVSWPGGPGILPPIRPIPGGGAAGPAGTTWPRQAHTPRPLPPKPELIGTLLGARPSAVFRSGGKLTVVSISETIGGWRLLTVEHGGVVIRSGNETARILVGGEPSSGIATSVSSPPVAPALSPTAPLAPPEQPPAAQPSPAQPSPQPAPENPPLKVPRSQPVAHATPTALGASTPAAEASTENVAIAEKVGAASPPAVTLEPVHSVTLAVEGSLTAQAAAMPSPPATAQPKRTPAITLASAPNEGVATAEAHAEHAVVGQQPAHLLAAEPSATPLTPSRALVSHPQPAPPVVSTSGTFLLTGELPEPSEEKAPERPTDPAHLPGRLILEWADEIEAEDEEGRSDLPKPS